MSQPLPRYTDTHTEDQRKLARILLETGAVAPATPSSRATAAGDERKLRGIPCIARGVGGTQDGSDPYRHVMHWPQP